MYNSWRNPFYASPIKGWLLHMWHHQLGMLHRLTHTQASSTSGFEVTANINTHHPHECILPSLVVAVFFCLHSSRHNYTAYTLPLIVWLRRLRTPMPLSNCELTLAPVMYVFWQCLSCGDTPTSSHKPSHSFSASRLLHITTAHNPTHRLCQWLFVFKVQGNLFFITQRRAV